VRFDTDVVLLLFL